jgi:nitrogen fixation protein NifQ
MREIIYQQLMAHRSGNANDETYARMLATWYSGESRMPPRLGLDTKAYQRLLDQHFPQVKLPPPPSSSQSQENLSRGQEQTELRALLRSFCTQSGEEAEWITDILVAGCMGNDHLWQDLGLWARQDLTELMQRNFTALARQNNQDMKWKKFLYKQLCLQEGIYTCRAPSCEVCVDYQACFGPED